MDFEINCNGGFLVRLFRQRLNNEKDQRFTGRVYIALVLALLYRPDVGTLIPQIAELTVFDAHTIALIFLGCGVWLRRSKPIHLLEYIAFLFPLAVFSGYIVAAMFTNLQSSVVLVVFIAAFWFKVFEALKDAVEALG